MVLFSFTFSARIPAKSRWSFYSSSSCFCLFVFAFYIYRIFWISLKKFGLSCSYSSTLVYFIGDSADFLSRFLIDFIFIIGWNFCKKGEKEDLKKKLFSSLQFVIKFLPTIRNRATLYQKQNKLNSDRKKWTKNFAVLASSNFILNHFAWCCLVTSYSEDSGVVWLLMDLYKQIYWHARCL